MSSLEFLAKNVNKAVEELEDHLREAGGIPNPDTLSTVPVASEYDDSLRTTERCNQSLRAIDSCEKKLVEELSEVTSEIDSINHDRLEKALQTLMNDVRSNLQMVRRILAKNVPMSAAMAAAS